MGARANGSEPTSLPPTSGAALIQTSSPVLTTLGRSAAQQFPRPRRRRPLLAALALTVMAAAGIGIAC